MNVIETKDLTKKYSNGRGADNISLTVKKGEVFGLLGPNGCGKTTFMKLLTGLSIADSGEYRLFEQEPAKDISVMKRVGCMIEEPAFYPHLTAFENLKILLRLYPQLSENRIRELSDKLGLTEYMNEPVYKFSMGMKQRLGFAAALIHSPELLILDEPANSLDIAGTAKMREMLKAFAANGGTILISSHITGEIQSICTKIAVMESGHILDISDTEDIIRRHGSVEEHYLITVGSGAAKQ